MRGRGGAGIVRFCTHAYAPPTPDNLADVYMHLVTPRLLARDAMCRERRTRMYEPR